MEFENNDDFSFSIPGIEEGGEEFSGKVTIETDEETIETPKDETPVFTYSDDNEDDQDNEPDEPTITISTLDDLNENTDSDSDEANEGGEADTDDDTKEPVPSTSAPSSPSFVTKFASALQKDGILTLPDEDIKNVKNVSDLRDAVKKTIESNEYSALGDRGKEALKAINNGVPIENVIEHHNREVNLSQYTEDRFIESDTDTDDVVEQKRKIRENIIYNGYKARNFSDAEASKLTKRSFDAGEDEVDARSAIAAIKESARAAKEQEFAAAEQKKKDNEEKRNAYRKEVMETEEVIPGLKISKEVAQWLADATTMPTGRKQDGTLRTVVSDKRDENPKLFNLRLNYLIKMGLFDEKPDLSFLGAKQQSSAIEELERQLSNDNRFEGGRAISLDSVAQREAQAEMFAALGATDI